MERKTIIYALGIVILCVLPFSYVLFREKEKEDYVPKETYSSVLLLDFEKNYPQNPHALIRENSKIIQALYGGEVLSDGQIKEALSKQRMLFSDEILERNTFESQVENTIHEIILLTENKQHIVSIEIESVLYDEGSDKICTVTTKQETTTGHAIRTEYRLAVITGEWKILGWKNTV